MVKLSSLLSTSKHSYSCEFTYTTTHHIISNFKDNMKLNLKNLVIALAMLAVGAHGSIGVVGDPHFKTWKNGHSYDYHGECDLVLVHSEAFESGKGLDIHIRTKIRRDFSYVSSAVLRIGEDILEVASKGVYFLNGVASADLPSEFAGFAFSHTQPIEHQNVFDVHLFGQQHIILKTYKDFVAVTIEQGIKERFGDSVGLMGHYDGNMLARDGTTVIEDPNAFGQEWQVLSTESKLFQEDRLPQHPQTCTLPSPVATSQLRRRLSGASDLAAAAERACAQWGVGKKACIYDVLSTGDLEMAESGY
jgi:hypothetical protein